MDLVESKQRVISPDKRHPWELARLEVIQQVIREFIRVQPGSNILDVGCGDAFLVAQIAKEYSTANFIAVDTALTPDLMDTLQKSWSAKNLTMFQDLEAAGCSLRSGEASLIMLLDVIEHIEDDVAFLQKLKSYPFVTERTIVLITVPAFQSLFCSHDKFLGHYRRYTNRTLNEHVVQAGYSPLHTSYFFTSCLPPRLLQVFKEKYLKLTPRLTTGLVEWQGGQMLARVLKGILLGDFKVCRSLHKCGINPWGLSNLTVCKPR